MWFECCAAGVASPARHRGLNPGRALSPAVRGAGGTGAVAACRPCARSVDADARALLRAVVATPQLPVHPHIPTLPEVVHEDSRAGLVAAVNVRQHCNCN